MKKPNLHSFAIIILTLTIFLAHATALQAQTRPRRVKLQPTSSPTETRPRRVHQPAPLNLPTSADRFLDRLNKLIDQYLQPLATKQKQ
jgi:hypothetical protein